MKVLVIEDEPALRRTLTLTLVEAGFLAESCADGREGLRCAIAAEYDLIVMDIMLPALDGWELLRELRREKPTPVIMLTARDALADRVKGLDGGADDYLTKPFAFEELIARIHSVLRRRAGFASRWLTAGEVALDLSGKKVLRAGAEVALTAREYSLLEYLMLRRGEVVSRTRLYDHLLGEDDDTMSNLMDVHVANLRKKLGADLIHTRRGLGYLVP
jgi:two-component system, OmpR family, response regulator